MELPIAESSYGMSGDALVRGVRRVAVALGRTAAEEVDLDGATCLFSGARPGVRSLNFAEHLAIGPEETADRLLDRVDEMFAGQGSVCHAWSTDGSWPEEMATALERRGHAHVLRHVLQLDLNSLKPGKDDTLQIIPVRAAYKEVRQFYRTKAVEAYAAAPDLAEALADTYIDRLDEPRLQLNLVRYDGRAVAVAGVFSLGEIGVISPAYCVLEYRGRGVASALMVSVLEHCRRAQFKYVVVDRADGCPAIPFYRRFGFSQVASYHRYRRGTK